MLAINHLEEGFAKVAAGALDIMSANQAAELASMMSPEERKEFWEEWFEANKDRDIVPLTGSIAEAAPYSAGLGLLGGVGGSLAAALRTPAKVVGEGGEEVTRNILKRFLAAPLKEKLMYGGGGLLAGALLPMLYTWSKNYPRNKAAKDAKRLSEMSPRARKAELLSIMSKKHPDRKPKITKTLML